MEAVLARSQSTRYPRSLVESLFSRNTPRSKSLQRPGVRAKGQDDSPMVAASLMMVAAAQGTGSVHLYFTEGSHSLIIGSLYTCTVHTLLGGGSF